MRVRISHYPRLKGLAPLKDPLGVGCLLYERGDQEVVGFTLSPAAAGALPVGEPWGGVLFAGAIKPLPPGEAAPQASERGRSFYLFFLACSFCGSSV